MRWFQEGIPSAIQAAKAQKSVFIVFICGEDEKSQEMESYLHKDDVTQLCEENRCVAIKLTSNGNEIKFFSQIYPVVVIPSTFFIGDTGVPLEVIGECKSHEDFLSKVKNAIDLQKKSSASVGEPVQSTSQASPPTQEVKGAIQTAVEADVAGASGGREDDTGEESGGPSESLEARMEKARLLLEEKKREKMRKEAEEERRRELERRNVGQGVQKLREKQKEVEILEAKKELKKDRDEEKLARQRVKDEIERDRQEKAARFGKDKAAQSQAEEEARKKKLKEKQAAEAMEQARRSDIARIQFRLPDGSSVTQQFPATERFATLHQFITQHMGTTVSLSMAFPRRTFTPDDHNLTLQELQLAPSAVILVIPGGISTSEVRSSSPLLSVSRMSSFVLAPFFYIWQFLSAIFGFSSQTRRPNMSVQLQSTATGGERNQRNAQKRPASSSSSRQEGPITRFRNSQDDDKDDDGNTWNGNSTQQM
ncbi:UBX domain-containing protein 4-like [Physella acuta]|uniref:UBX domain-containing protein 4-like n=1 Tax=Physella acuta TaxID=109671 RepID=UPI0027DB402E|nr:UBX domain-containing protein 4-like [Physella acuta]XP_059154159.1 UBX domain-containing protein 4-like [Physella acuta]XP_059154166.1 UBX domain-containing protein 4-like [Physella acuta]